MSTVVRASGALLGVVVAAAVAFVVAVRFRMRFVVDNVRRVARATQRLPLMFAGRGSAYASVVVHTGRASGRRYQTPVRAVQIDDGFVVALPYGSGSDWVRNVLARGGARMVYHDRVYELDQPRLVPLRDMESRFTGGDRRAHRLFGVTEALVAHATPVEWAEAERGSEL